jgi:hypothetical protein
MKHQDSITIELYEEDYLALMLAIKEAIPKESDRGYTPFSETELDILDNLLDQLTHLWEA